MLFLKECKKIICSITFVLYVAAVFAMYLTQFAADELDEPAKKPVPGDIYGSIAVENPKILVPAAVEGLISEYLEGTYITYPYLTYKKVKLKESDTVKIADIIEELTDITKEELDSFTGYTAGGYIGEADENGEVSMIYKDAVLPEYNVSPNLSYTRFKELMTEADKIIGKGSKYGEKFLVNSFSMQPIPYESALADYEELMNERCLAEGYMRLFCDYMGIVLAVVPVFVCVSFWQLDKRSRMEQLIYSRKISSARVVVTRYAALVFCMAVPVALTMFHAFTGIVWLYLEKHLYFGNAIGLVILWLLPSIMIVTGVGALTAELCSPFLAIFLQGAWWMYALMEEASLSGNITKYGLIIRHNALGKAAFFKDQYSNFLWNRAIYITLSIIAVALAVFLYEKARKGKKL